jgi:hypothetical protein
VLFHLFGAGQVDVRGACGVPPPPHLPSLSVNTASSLDKQLCYSWHRSLVLASNMLHQAWCLEHKGVALLHSTAVIGNTGSSPCHQMLNVSRHDVGCNAIDCKHN